MQSLTSKFEKNDLRHKPEIFETKRYWEFYIIDYSLPYFEKR